MTLHDSTFQYLKPTDDQMSKMADMRNEFTAFAAFLDDQLADGPDKTFVMRELRTLAMWCNVALTRNPDGSPRV